MTEASSLPAGTDSTEARLREENLALRKQVAQSVHLKQEVLQLSHRLDQESLRFEAMQAFIHRAVQTEDVGEFFWQVCESIIDLMECGVSMLWDFNAEENPGCLYQYGLGDVSEKQWRDLQVWVSAWMGRHESVDSRIFKLLGATPLPEIFGLRDDFLVEPVMDSNGRIVSLIFAANTLHQPSFHEGFVHSAEKVFLTFAKQVGVLNISLAGRATIAEQIERIRISEERLSTALSTSNVGLWDWDLNRDRIFYSDQWKAQLGYEPHEISDSGSEWVQRLHPEDRDHVLKNTEECIQTRGGLLNQTLRLRHKNGHWVWINCRGFNVSNPETGVRRMVGTHIDVTDFKALEGRLLEAEKKQRLAREQAEQESRAKSSFLASVSHEIRTPLNGIMASFQMLRVTTASEMRNKLIEMGEASGQWMLKIIGEGLDIARIEAGAMQLEIQTVDLHQFMIDLKALKSQRAEDLGINFSLRLARGVPRWVKVDPLRLRQILVNLIGNSFKFTSKGEVSVKLGVADAPDGGKQMFSFSISDSGVGISDEFKRIMFEPFTQATRRSESREHGIGLGLVITRELVNLMNGEIKVFSEPGIGSEFIVTLPLELAECGPGLPDAASSETPVFHGRVLLAEDDPVSGELGKLMIERLGLQVELARDGGQALEKAAGGGFDLIVMDCWMPVKSGIEVTRILRALPDEKIRNVPILALTANAQKSDADECREAGMDEFMTKPLSFQMLVEKLGAFLGSDKVPRRWRAPGHDGRA